MITLETGAKTKISKSEESSTVFPVVKLPHELVLSILAHLNSPQDIVNFGKTCRTFHPLSIDNAIWRRLFERNFPYAMASRTPSSDDDFYSLYIGRTRAHRNLCLAIWEKDLPYPPTEKTGTVTCICTHGEQLITGSAGGVIRIWNRCPREFEGRLSVNFKAISCITVVGDQLISSQDRIVRIWDLTNKTSKIILNNDAPITHFVTNQQIICACSRKKILIFDLQKNKHFLPYVMSVGRTCLSSAIANYRLYIGSDKTVWIYDFKEQVWLPPLRGFKSGVCCMQIASKYLYAASSNEIKVWDTATSQCLKTYTHPKEDIKSLLVHEDKLYAGSVTGYVQVWDIASGKQLLTYRAHLKGINVLRAEENTVETYSQDGTMITWDFDVRCASQYSQVLLQKNLRILKAALDSDDKDERRLLLLSLYSAFYNRYEKYSYASNNLERTVHNVKAELHLEMLLHAFYAGAQGLSTVASHLKTLESLSPEIANILYQRLADACDCGTENRIQWGHDAFRNQNKCEASYEQKVDAVLDVIKILDKKLEAAQHKQLSSSCTIA